MPNIIEINNFSINNISISKIDEGFNTIKIKIEYNDIDAYMIETELILKFSETGFETLKHVINQFKRD